MSTKFVHAVQWIYQGGFAPVGGFARGGGFVLVWGDLLQCSAEGGAGEGIGQRCRGGYRAEAGLRKI